MNITNNLSNEQLLNIFYNVSNSNNKNFNKQKPYLIRLLNSDLPILNTNESYIVTMILDKVSDNIKKTRFESLYNKLMTMKTKLNKRWAVFYFLLEYSNQVNSINNNNLTNTNTNNFIFNNVLNDMYINNNNGEDRNKYDKTLINYNNNISNKNVIDCANNPMDNMYNSIHNNTHGNIQDKTNNVIDNNFKSIANRAIVDFSKSKRIVTEKDIIDDLIYAFQGIDGVYLNYSNINDAYILNNNIPFKDSIYDIISQISELGWLFKKIKSIIEYLNSVDSQSQILQSFIYSIQNELNLHYK